MELVTVRKNSGHYDWARPDEIQIQYWFSGIPKDVCQWKSFILPEEYYFDLEIDPEESALTFAKFLLECIKRQYSYWSGEKDLQKIIDYLEKNKEDQDKLFRLQLYNNAVNERDGLMRRVEYLEKIIKDYEEEEKE